MKTHLNANLPFKRKLGIIIHIIAALGAVALMSSALAEDWGAYSIVPVSAKSMALEAVDSGASDGTIVSIGKPAGTPNQKWVITSKGENLFSIKPSHSSTLVLSVAKGAAKPKGEDAHGDNDCHQGNARDRRSVCQAGRLAAHHEGNAGAAQPGLRIRWSRRQ